MISTSQHRKAFLKLALATSKYNYITHAAYLNAVQTVIDKTKSNKNFKSFVDYKFMPDQLFENYINFTQTQINTDELGYPVSAVKVDKHLIFSKLYYEAFVDQPTNNNYPADPEFLN